jgi:hypothetical protein
MLDGWRLGAGSGDTERLGAARTGGQDKQQAKDKNHAHAGSLRPYRRTCPPRRHADVLYKE